MQDKEYIASLEGALKTIAKGHWEAKITNTCVGGEWCNMQWGTFATKQEAEAVAERERATQNDTGSYAYGIYVLDMDGEEILNLIGNLK